MQGISICLSVCLSFDYLNSRSSDRLQCGRCIAEDPRKCSVECEFVWHCNSFNLNQNCQPHGRVVLEEMIEEKVSGIHHLGIMNVCTKFHGNQLCLRYFSLDQSDGTMEGSILPSVRDTCTACSVIMSHNRYSAIHMR